MPPWDLILKYVNPQVLGLLVVIGWLLSQLDKAHEALRDALDSNSKVVVMLDTVLYEVRDKRS